MVKGFSATMKRLYVVAAIDYLCKDLPFESLTVNSISAEAGISPATFYRLFDSKVAAAIWYQNLVHSYGIAQTGRTLNWYDGFVVSTSGIELMKHFMVSAGQDDNYGSSARAAIALRTNSLIETLVNYRHIEVTDSLLFQIRFYAQGEIEVMRHWLKSDLGIEEMAAVIVKCVPKDLYDLLEQPVDPKPVQRLDFSTLLHIAGNG
jgi:AcrR family transcriptional regulator